MGRIGSGKAAKLVSSVTLYGSRLRCHLRQSRTLGVLGHSRGICANVLTTLARKNLPSQVAWLPILRSATVFKRLERNCRPRGAIGIIGDARHCELPLIALAGLARQVPADPIQVRRLVQLRSDFQRRSLRVGEKF